MSVLNAVTQTDDELLAQYAHPWPGGEGKFVFESDLYPYDRASALAVIKSNLMLGRPVTATFAAVDWLTLVTMVGALADRVEALEKR